MFRRFKFISAPIQLFLLTTSHKLQIDKNDVFANDKIKLLSKTQIGLFIHFVFYIYIITFAVLR